MQRARAGNKMPWAPSMSPLMDGSPRSTPRSTLDMEEERVAEKGEEIPGEGPTTRALRLQLLEALETGTPEDLEQLIPLCRKPEHHGMPHTDAACHL